MITKVNAARIILYAAIVVLVLSVVLTVASLYPVATGQTQSVVRVNDSFNLSVNEIWRQGLGNFHGGENVSIQVESPVAFCKNFSIVAYSGLRFNNSLTSGFVYNFTAGADYYEAVFQNASQRGLINFKVTVEQPQVSLPFSWLTTPAKILFFVSLATAVLVLLKQALPSGAKLALSRPVLPSLSKTGKQRLLLLVVLSLVCWLAVLALNSNPYASFENWYTDHPRHSYTASLFLKDGFAVFSQPLGNLASQDNSPFMFVTWPEMPHLYPLGSIFLFMPFGALLQSGVVPVLVYKLEIALFLVFAHVCLFFFLSRYWKQDLFSPSDLRGWKEKLRQLAKKAGWSQKKIELGEHTEFFIKLVGVYVIYTTLIVYAADGMFDSVAFVFGLFAVTVLAVGRYDAFFLLIGVGVFFKYQTAIFLMPLIIYSVVMLVRTQKLGSLKNKLFLAGAAFMVASGFTAVLSAPYLVATRPELVMNSISAFMPNAQIPWSLQSFAILLTLAATLVYVLYMHKRNPLMSLSALFLLVPSFLLPFFQNWYIPFIFVYVLVPQRKGEIVATMIWVIFLIVVLSFGASAFNPVGIIDNFRQTLKI
jgi:hypothetical protein